MDNTRTILEALPYIPADDYSTWVNVGMALKYEGLPLNTWRAWSETSPKSKMVKKEEWAKKWDSFKSETEKPVTGGTIVAMAKEHGYDPKAADEPIPFDYRLTEEDERKAKIMAFDGTMDDVPRTESGFSRPKFEEPKEWNPVHDMLTFLDRCFNPDEIVSFQEGYYDEKKGKWMPGEKENQMTAGSMIDRLKGNYQKFVDGGGDIHDENKLADVITGVIPLNPKSRFGGVWVRMNPIDPKRDPTHTTPTNKMVTDYRFALLESDDMPLEEQVSFLRKSELPITVMTFSGGKSVHALVRIDAFDEKDYRSKVNRLHSWCRKNGFKPDEKTKNPARLTRFPGCYRGEPSARHKQFIVDTNLGKSTFKEWEEWQRAETLGQSIPHEVNLKHEDETNPPKDTPEIISGLLRVGDKLMLSGASKAGKSFLVMEMAIAIASGGQWLGYTCKKSKVLYVNLELKIDERYRRFKRVCRAMGLQGIPELIDCIDFRGHTVPMDKLAPVFKERYKGKGYSVIIFDPIYKVMTGDENSAGDMNKFVNYFEEIAEETGTAAVLCHHHSKGAKGMAKAIDRMSGSGVFARDPEVIMDLISLEVDNALLEAWHASGAYRVSIISRQTPNPNPINIVYCSPIHKVVHGEQFEKAAEEGSLQQLQSRGRATANRNKQDGKEATMKLFDGVISLLLSKEPAGYIPFTTLSKEFCDAFPDSKKSDKTLRGYLTDNKSPLHAKYDLINGNVYMKKHTNEQVTALHKLLADGCRDGVKNTWEVLASRLQEVCGLSKVPSESDFQSLLDDVNATETKAGFTFKPGTDGIFSRVPVADKSTA